MNDKIRTIFSASTREAPFFPGKGSVIGYAGNINFVPESEDRVYHNKTKCSSMNADALETPLYSESMGVVSVKQFDEWKSHVYLDEYATTYYYVIQHRTNPDFDLHHWIAMQKWNNEQKEKAMKIFEDAVLELAKDSVNDFNDLEETRKFIFSLKPSVFKEVFSISSHHFINYPHLNTNSVKFSCASPVAFKLIRLILFFFKWILYFWT